MCHSHMSDIFWYAQYDLIYIIYSLQFTEAITSAQRLSPPFLPFIVRKSIESNYRQAKRKISRPFKSRYCHQPQKFPSIYSRFLFYRKQILMIKVSVLYKCRRFINIAKCASFYISHANARRYYAIITTIVISSACRAATFIINDR